MSGKKQKGNSREVSEEEAHRTDKYVGAQIKLFRIEQQVTQSTLGDALGLTFQQIQKYERGSNRISPGRLLMVAKVLKQPISSFFPDPAARSRDARATQIASTTGAFRLLSAFNKVRSGAIKLELVRMAEVIADNG